MVMPVFAAGQKVTGALLNQLSTQIDTLSAPIVRFATRNSNGTGTTTTELSYLRLDNIPIINGQAYLIQTTPLIFDSNAANDAIQVFLRGSTSGAATTASTGLTLLCQPSRSISSFQYTACMNYLYTATTTGNLSVLMSYVRVLGTGTVKINASTDIPAQIIVQRVGTAPADNGTDL